MIIFIVKLLVDAADTSSLLMATTLELLLASISVFFLVGAARGPSLPLVVNLDYFQSVTLKHLSVALAKLAVSRARKGHLVDESGRELTTQSELHAGCFHICFDIKIIILKYYHSDRKDAGTYARVFS